MPCAPIRLRVLALAAALAGALAATGCADARSAVPTVAPTRPIGGATVVGLPTAVVTRDPYALPTSTTYGGIRATVTTTPPATAAPPTATPARTATPHAEATQTPVASPEEPAEDEPAEDAPAVGTPSTGTPSAGVPSAGTSTPPGAATGTATPVPPMALPPTAAATPAPAGGLALSIIPGRSSAAFRVNEQLVGKDLPGDAVGSTAAVSGVIAIGPDGGVDQSQSRVVVDLNGLRTDNAMRDAFVRRNVLEVDSYPNAVFVPSRAEGLPFPLPESGAATFRLVGTLTIHGTSREVTWDVTARRAGGDVSGTANATITFTDFGLVSPKVGAVISVSNEIRLEISLVATVAR